MRTTLTLSMLIAVLSSTALAHADGGPAKEPGAPRDVDGAPHDVDVPASAGAAPSQASSQPASSVARFRSAGTVVLDDVVGTGIGTGALGELTFTLGWLSASARTSEAAGNRVEISSLRFAPSADFFVVDGFSVGGLVAISRTRSATTSDGGGGALVNTESTSSAREIAPRLGYAFRLTDDLLLWPRAYVGIGTKEVSRSGGGGVVSPLGGTGSSDGSFWSVGADASLVIVLARHAALTLGPKVAYAYSKVDEPRAVATAFDVGARGSLRLVF